MNELVELVAGKAGIPTQQAKMAVDAVMDFLNTRLPAPVANQVRQALSGGSMINDQTLKQAGDMLGGLFKK